MAEGDDKSLQILRAAELRLLRCSLPPETLSTSEPLETPLETLLESIESGLYSKALTSDATSPLFLNLKPSSSLFSDSIINCFDQLLISSKTDAERCYRLFLGLAVSVSAFLAFLQCNFTGPPESFPWLFENFEKEDLEVWARNELMSAGSDLLGKFSNSEYLVFAKVLLLKIRDFLLSDERKRISESFPTVSWWLARVLLVQQKMLDGRSSSLYEKLQELISEVLNHLGSLEKVSKYWMGTEQGILTNIVSMVYLEVGIIEFRYGHVDSSMLHLESAQTASGIKLSLTGAMGFRTVHQVDPKAQLRLFADVASSTNGGSSISDSAAGENKVLQHDRQIHEASNVFLTPRFLEDSKEASGIQSREVGDDSACFSPVQQALILAQCLLVEKRSRHDEMQRWDMAPYIEAIDSQPSSLFIIRCFCDLLRVRWERTRSHTKERAIMMMDKLVQGLYESSPGVASRICCSFGVDLPTIPILRKEYADLLINCGLVGEAIKVYEDLELWDNVIYCYGLLQKKSASAELIKTRLVERPNDPRLWCSLGDVTSDDSCYHKALEVSHNKSERAKRSLARSAYNRGDYEKSKLLWESAMASNSSYPDGWFALGAAALKARDVDKALVAFTYAVQVDPDNGEAWNNIACLHMTKKRNALALIAFKEALRFKRDSWQMWENYSQVAVGTGNFGLAMEAIQKVLSMTNSKRVDVKLLERIMLEIEGNALSCPPQSPAARDNEDSRDQSAVNSAVNGVGELSLERTREKGLLIEMIGKILQQIARTGGSAEIWGLFARWHKLKGDLTMCSEALLKQIRSYQGSELWKDEDRFKKFAHASLELCKVYSEISSRDGGQRELRAAEMHLKSTIRQAAPKFSETKEFRELQMCFDKLQASLVPSA